MWSAKLTIAYNGAKYVGWQLQKNGVSVQQKLEEGWTNVTGETLRFTASGRTDSGVHALAQVCSCHTETELSPATLIRALNAMTPQDICILNVERAVDDFHAIRDATSKSYQYRIQYDSRLSPFDLESCWFIPKQLNLAAMRKAASRLVGEMDFASFETKGSPRNTTIRTVSQLELIESQIQQFKYLTIEISANGFLYNMARNIVGTLVEIGQGTRKADWIEEVLAARDRNLAGMTAPAHALYLKAVEYPECHLYLEPSGESNSAEC